MSIAEKLTELGIVLPKASKPAGNYTSTVEINGLVFVSGKAATGYKGKLGKEFTTAQGYQFAKLTGIEILATLESSLGSLDRVKRIVKIQGYVNATPEFEEHPEVLDGCSDLMVAVFGEKGIHARSVQGVASLRKNVPISIEAIVAVNE